MKAHTDVGQRKKAEALHKLQKKLNLAFEVLDSDLRFAEEQWAKDESSQFWRRTLVRCFCASIEGILSLLKNVTPDIADYFEVALTPKDMEVITERSMGKDGNPKKFFLPIRDSIKTTLKLYAKAHTIQVPVKYDVRGIDDLENTFELRHRLMHPKDLFGLQVSDQAIDAVIRSDKWFGDVLRFVLGKCVKQRPFPQSNTK